MSRIMRKFYSLSIKKKLMLSYSVLIIVPILLLMLFSNKMINNIVLEKINKANTDLIESTSKRVDRLLYDVTYTLLYISRSKALRDIVKSDTDMLDSGKYNSSNVEFKQHYDDMQNIFENAPLSMLMLSSNITVLCQNGIDYGNWQEFYKYAAEYKNSRWYSKLMRSTSENVQWIGINKTVNNQGGKNSYMLEAAIPIKDTSARARSIPYSIGVVHLAIPEQDVFETLQSDSITGSMLLIDNNMNVISSKDKSLIGMPLANLLNIDQVKFDNENWYITRDKDNKEVVVNMTTINKTLWKVVSISPYNELMAQLSYVRNMLLLASLLFIILFLGVSILISKSISNPIIHLERKIMLVEQGNLDERVDVQFNDEIGNLGRNFNNMLDKINDLLKVIKLKEKLKRDAEFEALQAQINPHFLFNTLSSIRWAAAAHGDTKVEEMVLALSNLLRMSISKGAETITLKEEIAILMHYVDICKMRQGFSYQLDCNIDEEILAVKIPRLILQPIVENSIIHGFEEMKSGGIIRISGAREGNTLKIEIADNGKGIDTELLENILNGKILNGYKDKRFSKIGIKNVDERIKLHFGEEFGLSIANGETGGTVATLLLPFQKGEIDNA